MLSNHVDPVTSDLPGKHRSDGADWERCELLDGLAIIFYAAVTREATGPDCSLSVLRYWWSARRASSAMR
jgi:hypothetical protein